MAKLRRFSGFSVLSLLSVLSGAAEAGTFPYWGFSFGTSERTAVNFGVTFGASVPSDVSEGLALGTGPLIEGTVGMGAAKLGIGKSFLVLTGHKAVRLLTDWKAVATRTWDRPRGASAHATYLGLEGGLSLSFVRLNLGLSKRLERKSSGAGLLVTWGLGAQIRLGGARRAALRWTLRGHGQRSAQKTRVASPRRTGAGPPCPTDS